MPARVLDLLLFITAVGLPLAGGFAEGPPVEVFKSVCESMMPLGHCKAPSTGSQRRRREDINCAKDLKNRAVPSTAMSPYELVVPPCYKNAAINGEWVHHRTLIIQDPVFTILYNRMLSIRFVLFTEKIQN